MSQRIIGLTGGIATGKSTVADYVSKSYQVPILDADIYARDVFSPKLLNLLQERYGSDILGDRYFNNEDPNQNTNLVTQVDRAKLATIIFNSPQERVWLESQIHPYVRDRLQSEAKLYRPRLVMMVVPLLFEAKMQDLVTETWVVFCPLELELERLMQRDRLDLTAAQIRISSQMPISEKVAIADFVLDNSSTLFELFHQVDKLMAEAC